MTEHTPGQDAALILENGEAQHVTWQEVSSLEQANLVYHCQECRCYHVVDTWEAVDIYLVGGEHND